MRRLGAPEASRWDTLRLRLRRVSAMVVWSRSVAGREPRCWNVRCTLPCKEKPCLKLSKALGAVRRRPAVDRPPLVESGSGCRILAARDGEGKPDAVDENPKVTDRPSRASRLPHQHAESSLPTGIPRRCMRCGTSQHIQSNITPYSYTTHVASGRDIRGWGALLLA